MKRHAIVRQVSESFGQALRRDAGGPSPDPAEARQQHTAYCAALRAIGLSITVLPSLDDHPDACFVEDRLVMGWGRALATYSRTPTRRGETPTLAEAVTGFAEVTIMGSTPTGGLDGGDVIRLGNTLLVGLSARTDKDGIAALTEWLSDLDVTIVPVHMANGLHLKCFAAPLSHDVLLCAEGWPYRSHVPSHIHVIEVPAEERYAANAVATDFGVVMALGHPQAIAAVERTGRRVVPVDVSAFRRADGSLTCLSVLFGYD